METLGVDDASLTARPDRSEGPVTSAGWVQQLPIQAVPTDVALTEILREGRVIVPAADIALEGVDELLLVATTEVEGELDRLLSGS
jgi:hypothetical protein